MWKYLVIFSFILLNLVNAQVASFLPTKPENGDTLTITYNPYTEGSRFAINDNIYCIYWERFIDGEHTSKHIQMRKKDSVFITQLSVNRDVSSINVFFITLSEKSWDANADLNIIIYDSSGIPMRNAQNISMELNNYNELFRQEIEQYPDNYAVYRNKWFYDKFLKPDNYRKIITTEKESFEYNGINNVEKLYALSYAYLLLGDYSRSIELFIDMKNDFPEHPYTIASIQHVLYELSVNNIKDEQYQESVELAEELLNSLDTKYVKDFFYSKAPLFSDSTIIKLCTKWMKHDKEDPRPFYLLAYYNNKLAKDFKGSEVLIIKYIDKVLSGDLRLKADISGKMTSMILPYAYHTLGEISLKLKKYTEALSAAKASQQLNSGNKKDTYELEGNVWFELGNYKNAESAYLAAWKEGLEKGKDLLLKCFSKTRNSSDKFDAYFQKLIREENNNIVDKAIAEENGANSAPSFNVKTINGTEYSSESLRGKVIIMNFWFTGCGPCRQEFPYLNELTEMYSDKDVVFLGFALDDNIELLNKFLAKYEFHYEIIADAADIASLFGISMYPSSLVIDKKGQVATRFNGGGEKIKNDISAVLDRLL